MSENTDRRFAVGDIVRVTFDNELLEAGQFIEAKIFAVVGWASQTNYRLDLPQELLYTANEEEIPIGRDIAHIIEYQSGSIEFYEQVLQGVPCTIEKLR